MRVDNKIVSCLNFLTVDGEGKEKERVTLLLYFMCHARSGLVISWFLKKIDNNSRSNIVSVNNKHKTHLFDDGYLLCYSVREYSLRFFFPIQYAQHDFGLQETATKEIFYCCMFSY